MKHYTVKEVFYSIQGEGALTGTPAVFVRFAGCNKPACYAWCDTDFAKGEKMTAQQIVQEIVDVHPTGEDVYVVLTGGEPMLQIDDELICALGENYGWEFGIETNGTVNHHHMAGYLENAERWHVCVSPKGPTLDTVIRPDEVKLVYPQDWITSKVLDEAEARFDCPLFLQPRDNSFLLTGSLVDSTSLCLGLVLARPRWRLSLQTHKILGVR